MRYIIMCGGTYDNMKTPKQMIKINGEMLVERTIRLLRENGITNIAISSLDKRFDIFGVPRLEHQNNWHTNMKETISGYWVDAFYPTKEPTTYLFGDVYYSENCIKTIIENETDDVLFFASSKVCRPDYPKMWEEPFAFKVVNQDHFRRAIEVCKKKRDRGETNREPISWELYRVLNGIPINLHRIRNNFIAINDISTDIDYEEERIQLENLFKKGE